jgi:hypothetical protein
MKTSDVKFYVFTPAKVCSGGPEALHQLAYYLHKLGLNAYTVYYDYSGFKETQTIDRYKEYEVAVAKYENVEDVKENYVIAPENAPWCLNGFKRAQKCVWWLSVAYSNLKVGTWKEKAAYQKRVFLGQNVMNYRNMAFNHRKVWHLCGSKYAFEYVRQRFPKSVVEYMVEPISLDFLQLGNADLSDKRDNIVLYNPAKPSNLMTELLERARFKYVPLKGFSPLGLAQIYKKAKLYVDFGEFGGPERMPKEAVYFGCNILVANHNAAANDFDVAIPQKYKVDDSETAEQIEFRIADMLQNYEKQKMDFLPFKLKVEGLEKNFINQLKDVFGIEEVVRHHSHI